MEYYGVDIHKRYSVFTCKDEQGGVLRRGRVANRAEELVQMVAPSGGTATVVLEATGNWAYIYETLEPWVAQVVLAHPLRVKAIASAKVKTDKVDGDTLADLLRADLIPAAYIPPREIRELRDWLRSRTAVVWMATELKNRVHSLLEKNGLYSPVTDLFGKQGRTWLEGLELRRVHRDILDRYLILLDALNGDIQQMTAEVGKRARQDPKARLLMTIPGIGPLTALLFLAEVGDVHRFPDARRLVSYAGLAPIVRASGGRVHLGPISKQGSSWLRWVFTQASARVGHRPGPLGEFYWRIRRRHGKQTAVIALARKLLVIAYFVLKSGHRYEARG
ncbi:MAG: IS110 family transposase [Chloroflexota bacterium]|nr:IS110 family transposase [Chloroflexota bacterium]